MNDDYTNEHEKPIFSAVSILSPVNIHTLILAFIKSAMHSLTSSYNLSSTAVQPIKVKPVSIKFEYSFIFYYLSTKELKESICIFIY